MDNVSKAFIKSLPINIANTLLIGIVFNNIWSAMLGMVIGSLLFIIIAGFIEWKKA